jgi:hypothetical protein
MLLEFWPERKMKRTADLETALRFVIKRIEEEAKRSGEPLSDEQRFLLNHLPTYSAWTQPYGGDPEIPAQPIPRDATYERVCAVAKAAHRHDLQLNPGSVLDWEFAAAVSRLNRHPVSWLLQWAGVKESRPWWDRWLLVAAALLFIFSVGAVMLLAGSEPWTGYQWIAVGAGYIAIVVLLYFVSRRIEERQLRQNIERCRRGSASVH